MRKVGRPKKTISHFIDLAFYLFLVSVFVLTFYPAPLTLTVVGFFWLVGEVANAFK